MLKSRKKRSQRNNPASDNEELKSQAKQLLNELSEAEQKKEEESQPRKTKRKLLDIILDFAEEKPKPALFLGGAVVSFIASLFFGPLIIVSLLALGAGIFCLIFKEYH